MNSADIVQHLSAGKNPGIPPTNPARLRGRRNGVRTLRMDKATQWEIRQYANAVTELIAAAFPRTWELYKTGVENS